jgi:hypothetical protein
MSSIIAEIEQYLELYRGKTNSVPVDQLTVDDVSLLKGCQIRSAKTQEMDYKRGWAKLAKAQKLNRLMHYHKKLATDYDLTAIQQAQLKTLFYNGVGISGGMINNIVGLKQDTDGIFYFDAPVAPMLTLNTMKKVTVIEKFVPVSIEQLTNAGNKIKPMIKKKNDHNEK